MSLIQDLYMNNKISSEEMSKLSEIRAGLFNAMECGHKHTVEFIAETLESCSDKEVEKLAAMVDAVEAQVVESAIQQYSEEDVRAVLSCVDMSFEKTAARRMKAIDKVKMTGLEKIWQKVPGSLKKVIPPVAAAAILGTLGLSLIHSAGQGLQLVSHPIATGVTKIRHHEQSKAVLAEILKESPELKRDPKTIENFNLLIRYAPETVATNKPVAEAMLKKMQQWGHVDPQSLQQMIQMEGQQLKNVSDSSVFPRTLKPSLARTDDWMMAAGLGS